MAGIRTDSTIADNCQSGIRWKDVPQHKGGVMRAVRLRVWDLLYHVFTRLSTCCSAHYIKAKYGTYPAWYRK